MPLQFYIGLPVIGAAGPAILNDERIEPSGVQIQIIPISQIQNQRNPGLPAAPQQSLCPACTVLQLSVIRKKEVEMPDLLTITADFLR